MDASANFRCSSTGQLSWMARRSPLSAYCRRGEGSSIACVRISTRDSRQAWLVSTIGITIRRHSGACFAPSVAVGHMVAVMTRVEFHEAHVHHHGSSFLK